MSVEAGQTPLRLEPIDARGLHFRVAAAPSEQADVVVVSDAELAAQELDQVVRYWKIGADTVAEAHMEEAQYHASEATRLQVEKADVIAEKKQLGLQLTTLDTRVTTATVAEQQAKQQRDDAEVVLIDARGQHDKFVEGLGSLLIHFKNQPLKNSDDVGIGSRALQEFSARVQQLATAPEGAGESTAEQLMHRVVAAEATFATLSAEHAFSVEELGRAKADFEALKVRVQSLQDKLKAEILSHELRERSVAEGARRTREDEPEERQGLVLRVVAAFRRKEPLTGVARLIEQSAIPKEIAS